MRKGYRDGQAVLEYVMALAILLMLGCLLLGFATVEEGTDRHALTTIVRRYAVRAERLVSSEYP